MFTALSDRFASVLAMNPIAFVPSSRALFVSDAADQTGLAPVTFALFDELRQQGYPDAGSTVSARQ